MRATEPKSKAPRKPDKGVHLDASFFATAISICARVTELDA
jgi:hypothetical protein